MTLTQSLSTSTTTVSSYVVRKVVTGTLATAAIIALGFVAATQSAGVLSLISKVSLTDYMVVLAVTVGVISMVGVRESVVEGKKQQFDIR